MGIPSKKQNKTTSANRVKQAIQATETEEVKQVSGIEAVQVQTLPKKLGRPALKADRNAKITFYLSQETSNRFNLALPQEQIKRITKGEKVDKSLILEEALLEWLQENKY